MRAGGRLHGGYHSTIVRILQGGWGITWADGLVVACALLQRGDWFGVRRCPTCPPSNVCGYRGYPPAGDQGCCCGLRPPSAEGSGLACAAIPPAPLGVSGPPPNLPPSTRAGDRSAPCPLFWGGRRRRLLAWRVGVRFLTWPPLGGRDRIAPEGGLGEGDGTVAKGDPARSQRGHSPVKRGRSAVMAATAVRPRCDGLFPARAALRRFSEEGDTLYPRRGLLPNFPTSMGTVGCPCRGAMERAGDFVSCLRNGIEREGDFVSCLRDGTERVGVSVSTHPVTSSNLQWPAPACSEHPQAQEAPENDFADTGAPFCGG